MDMLDRIEALLQRQSTLVLTTLSPDGFPAARAMLKPRGREGLRNFFFSTNTASNKVRDIGQNSKCALYVYDPASFEGALFQGKAEVSREERLRRALWREGDEAYYPLGVDDADYSVIRFIAFRGRFYDGNQVSTDFSLLAGDYFSSRSLVLRMSER